MSRWLVAGALALWAAIARPDPDEAWIVRASLPAGLRPLLVLVVDRSAAMANAIPARAAYDPAADYGAGLDAGLRCERGLVYWRRGPGPAPDCTLQQGLDATPGSATQGLHCDAARGALATHGFFIAARAAQWAVSGSAGHWAALQPDRVSAVECRSDRGRHGSTGGDWYAADGAEGPWSATAGAEIAWDRAPLADPYVFYTGNYLNFLRAPPPAVPMRLADIAAASLAAVAAAADELEIALVVTSATDGGWVALAATDAPTVATRLPLLLADEPAGGAPLAEALAETAAWLSGTDAHFGDRESADPGAFEPAGSTRYRSPIAHACRPVTVGLVTAGRPSEDESAAQAAGSLPGFSAGCGDDCLASLAAWLQAADLRGDLAATQSAAFRWIAPADAGDLLAQASAAADRIDDPQAFIGLAVSALQRDAAVAAGPRLSAAGLLPAGDGRHAPAVLFALTVPRPAQRWQGNLYRYGLRAPDSPLALPVIADRDGEPAIDAASGLPRPSSRSHWSDAPDADLLAGGAAGRLPIAGARRLYSNLGPDQLSDPENRLAVGNPRLDRALFGLGAADSETPDSLVDWLAGSRRLGDPGLAAPVVADYPDQALQVAFIATHDGLVHAFDADDGTELWAFLPRELLGRLRELSRNAPTTVRSHGIDSALVLHRHDANRDGRIDPAAGEHLLLLFGLGRGGNGYYALDVSSPSSPSLLWSRSPSPGERVESWAPPVVVRRSIADAVQSDGHWVALLAGGYDRAFDSAAPRTAGAGNSLSIIDALTGAPLWRASGSDAGDTGLLAEGLDASLPSAPRALDRDGDGELDRAYVTDVTGGVWRFDFSDGQAASSLATATRVAHLGDGTQRFFAPPDISLVRRNGRLQTALAVGSGWLSRPRDTAVGDRVYVVFEPESVAAPADDGSLHDATGATEAIPTQAAGWYVRLARDGEKVIGSTVTFDGVLRFQTYQPLPSPDDAPCGPPRAAHRLYALDIVTGLPRPQASVNEEDEEPETGATGLPAALRFAFPARLEAPCAGCRPRPFGLAGARRVDPSYFGDPVRTSWRRLPPASP